MQTTGAVALAVPLAVDVFGRAIFTHYDIKEAAAGGMNWARTSANLRRAAGAEVVTLTGVLASPAGQQVIEGIRRAVGLG